MIKFVAAALWISIATTGAILMSFQFGNSGEDAAASAEPNAFQGLDYVQTGVISVPVFNKGRVEGYFLARLVFTARGTRLAQLKLPAEALLTDQVYTQLYASPEVDFTKRDSIDIDAFRQAIRTGVNERIGEPLIEEVLVQQVDYLPKGQAGSSQMREPAPAAAGG